MSDFRKVALLQVTDTSPWLWVVGLAVVIAFLERVHPQQLDATTGGDSKHVTNL